jgi:predicted site-specific integrase-resolvase
MHKFRMPKTAPWEDYCPSFETSFRLPYYNAFDSEQMTPWGSCSQMVIQWDDTPDCDGNAERVRVPSAEYVRMSTEHQKYSTDNQASAIRRYAEKRGYEIVRTYADEGKSGLRLDGRDALKKLLEDVQAAEAGFSAVLVYDVSRWGRFQDPDEAAAIELTCKRAGIAVHYCAEQFENDGSIG